MLELRRGRQHHVGVRGGVGHELLEHDGEQVVAAQAVQHAVWSGAIAAGFEFQHDERATGGSSAGSVSASPSWDMLIVRAGRGTQVLALQRRSELTAAAVAVGM